MCGIVSGVAVDSNIVPFLLSGLSALEYRGYDSAGLAVQSAGKSITRSRTSGRVVELIGKVGAEGTVGTCGIAHTRWATHGEPTVGNAHPHVSGPIAIVHNGIIENHIAVRERLKEGGAIFNTPTDSEVIAHLVAKHYDGGKNSLLFAVTEATKTLEGVYAFAAIAEGKENEVVGVSHGAPLVVGVGKGAHYLASDMGALFSVTQQSVRLQHGEAVRLTPQAFELFSAKGEKIVRAVKTVEASKTATHLGEYQHYMQKEIFEQPLALAETIEYYGADVSALIGALDAKLKTADLKAVEQVIIIGCGTSYHAGLTAKYWLEQLARLPCSVEIASEYRYRPIVIPKNTLVIAISQSGETADTLSALTYAKSLNPHLTMCITNVAHSAIVDIAYSPLLTHAGPEIGVASTKAFTTQLSVLSVLSIALGLARGVLSTEQAQGYLDLLLQVPQSVRRVLELAPAIEKLAESFIDNRHALFLGRGIHYPIALEGALKLKEISYIHAEAYPSGELKHGPLALVDKQMPVIAVAPDDALLSKLLSNLEEVRSRGGRLFVFSENAAEGLNPERDEIINLPKNTVGPFSPIVNIVPLQLLSYFVAVLRGTDVDHPRNLAKSVTVE